MINWKKVLLPGQKGLVVEDETDAIILETFLDAGEKSAYWSDWRRQLVLTPPDKPQGKRGVLSELRENITNPEIEVWGLIDRDDNSPQEIIQLEQEYLQLLVLPRWTIENYVIAPDEISRLFPQTEKITQLTELINTAIPEALRNGALWLVLSESGAHRFCRGSENGYPMAILSQIWMSDTDIETQLQAWYQKLEPAPILTELQIRLKTIEQDTSRYFIQYIHGKKFFNQVIISALNKIFRQQSADFWLKQLTSDISHCPPDLIPLFKRVLI
jgi:hypothetical protein